MLTDVVPGQEIEIVDRRTRVNVRDFRRDYIDRNMPVVLTGTMRDWPAMRMWSFDYFASLADDREHRLDVGNVMQDATRLGASGLRAYVESLREGSGSGDVRYLANFDLFGAFPALRDDIDMSLIRDNKRHAVASGWIGPAGTFTGWHTDYADNILAQVHGRKIVDLIPASFGRGMYPSAKFDRGATISRVGDRAGAAEFPLHHFLRFERVVLDPGTMVFIPKGWWHRVRSAEPSISVSFLGFSWQEEFGVARNAARARTALHLARLYGRDDCTCHLARS